MKKLSFVLMLVLLCAMLAACSASAPRMDYNGGALGETYETEAVYDYAEADGGVTATAAKSERKVIKTATMSLECKNAGEAYDGILSFVLESGGYESSRVVNNGDYYQMVDATLMIPSDKLDALIDRVNAAGKGSSLNKKETDVTDQYADLRLRIDVKRGELENYREILKKAATIQETVTVQKEIDGIVLEIERMQGQLNGMQNKIDYSEFTLTIREERQPDDGDKWKPMTIGGLGSKMAGGFKGGANLLIIIVQGLLVAMMAVLPFVIIPGLILLVVFILRRRRKRRSVITVETVKNANP